MFIDYITIALDNISESITILDEQARRVPEIRQNEQLYNCYIKTIDNFLTIYEDLANRWSGN